MYEADMLEHPFHGRTPRIEYVKPSDGRTFLSLPGELRNHIYMLLLGQAVMRPKGMSKSPASTTFMATCRQVHSESVGMLYD